MDKAGTPPLALRLSGACSFVLVAALGTFATTSGPARSWATLAAALLSLAPAALFGLFSLAVARLLGPSLGALASRLSLRRFFDRDPRAPREPVIELHASVLALGLWLGLMSVTSKLLLLRLRSIESIDLRETLSVVGVAGLAGGFALLAALSLWPLRRSLAALDRAIALPVPPSAKLRTIVWLGLPLCALAIFGLWALESLLGPRIAPLWLVLVLGVDWVLYALLADRFSSTRIRKREWLVLAIALPVSLWGAHRALAGSVETTLELERSRPGSMLLGAARSLSDVDRDGASAFFGEHDCAAFSAARGPTARDVPGNGIDENCDGADAKPGSMPRAPTFFGGLRKEDVKDYDIVWFVVDAMRADHTSLLGYGRPTTPTLDELAPESLVFTRAYSQSSATMLSFPSMLTGIDPGRLKWVRDPSRLQVAKHQRRYLSDMLAGKRYQTGFVAAPYIKGMLPGLLAGWSWVGIASREQKISSSTAAALATGFIVRAREKPAPFLLMTYLAAPHALHRARAELSQASQERRQGSL